MVNCRRRNALRIGELDEDLSAKDYDQGKTDNGKNHARNIKNNSVDVCSHLSKVIENVECNGYNKRLLCLSELGCRCTKPRGKCGKCVLKSQATETCQIYKYFQKCEEYKLSNSLY